MLGVLRDAIDLTEFRSLTAFDRAVATELETFYWKKRQITNESKNWLLRCNTEPDEVIQDVLDKLTTIRPDDIPDSYQ